MSFDPNAPVAEANTPPVQNVDNADTPSGQPPFSDNPANPVNVPAPTDVAAGADPVDTAGVTPADVPVDQAGAVQVNPADSEFVNEGVVAPNERPLDKDGNPLVPGTPDEQIVADRVDGPVLATNTDYSTHVEEITAKLDELITLLGKDLSDAVLSEFKHERVAGITLRLAVEALQTARRVIGSLDLSGSGAVGVSSGVV